MKKTILNYSVKYFHFTERINKPIIYLFFVVLCLLVWVEPFSFFRGDDWSFIIDFYEGKNFKDYALIGHGAHVIPLFQFFYNIELEVFGKNAICFQVLSVLIFSFIPYIFHLILKQISPSNNTGIILLVSAILCLHPNFSDIIFWIFQQGVIIHIVFQFLSILCYFKYLEKSDNKLLIFFFTFLVIQNYTFGNGVLFPFLFIADYLVFRYLKREIKFHFKLFIVLLITQILFVFIQIKLSLQPIELATLITHTTDVVYSFFKLVHVSITRFFFIRQFGGNISEVIAGIIFVGSSILAFKYSRRYFLFGLLYLIVVSIAIPIGRYSHLFNAEAHEVHYYYTILLFPPFAFLLFLTVSNLGINMRKLLVPSLFMVFMGYSLVNIQVKKIHSYKNFKNKQGIMWAFRYSKNNYYPFEDQMYSNGKSFLQALPFNQEIQKSIQKSDYFGFDSSVVELIGKDSFNNFLINNNKMIKSYRFLEENSKFNLDIKYEDNE